MNANGQPPPTLRMGEMIPYLTKPIIGKKRGNKLVALANGMLKARILRGAPQDGIYITPQGVLFALADSGGSTGTGSVISMYKITAVFGDYVVARTWDGTTLGQTDVFIAKPTPLRTSFITDGVSTFVYSGSNQRTKTTSGTVETQNLYPTYDVNEVIFAGTSSNGTAVTQAPSVIEVIPARAWFTVSDSPPLQSFRVKEVFADVYRCRAWNGTTESGGDVYVAKNAKLRNAITSENIDGVNYSYAYDATYVLRTANDGSSSELQEIVPRILINDIIVAMELGTALSLTKVPGDPAISVTFVDVNWDARAWCSTPNTEE